ncbi:conserved hypothetical protein [Capnocytophaga canimorsus]|uniref:Lipoprotein n=1 Tax=Capnocytophaga canimorsus TaxID=28188 RepID=A0A0B7IGH7_9FLAO|nr:hypothetical protein [Capnocytophaga canimorsus]CEN49684.1 conserved hypothetical protein [Capnocytophaga canimorsus]
MRNILFLLLLFLCSCDFSSKKKQESKESVSNNEMYENESSKNDSITEVTYIKSFFNEDLPLEIHQISEKEFHTAQSKATKSDSIPKITNFAQAEKLLKDIITFQKYEERWLFPQEIRFRNGTKLDTIYDLLNEIGFAAYFPTEDIVLFEGGHSSDVSFNLSNGKETEEVGNPDYVIASPNNRVRLNGFYGGQECVFYFIQQYKNGQWQKTINLDHIFEKITTKMLCNLSAFWADDTTLYLAYPNYDEQGTMEFIHYKIILKPTISDVTWSDFPTISFPKKEQTNADNYDLLPALNSRQARLLLSGLFPDTENFKRVYSVPFSDDFTSVVVAFQQGEHQFSTILFNLDKNNQIIDYLLIAYDEIAESAVFTESILNKDSIVVRKEFYENAITFTYEISPKGEFVLKKVK